MSHEFPEFTDFDRNIWEKELDSFVPDHIIDFHTHIWNEKYSADNEEENSILRTNVSFEDLHSWSQIILPNRTLGYVVLSTPLRQIDFYGHNSWVSTEIESARAHYKNRLLLLEPGMLVHPLFSDTYLIHHIQKNNIKVLKPYRTFSSRPASARIRDYLPERQMVIANKFGLAIILHLSKMQGPADKENLDDLLFYTKEYPKIKWVLAHCARAFNSVHLEESIHLYAAMPHVWIDTAAVNDIFSHALLLKYFDRERILYGSDNVAAGSFRGKYITFGTGWKCFTETKELEHCDSRCTFVVYEQLRSQKQAVEMVKIPNSDIENIFSHNAEKFFQSFS